jgi:hypothetical protein
MRSSITFGFGANGVPVAPNRQINITHDDPDVTDVGFTVLLNDLIATGTAVYLAYEGDFKAAAAAITPVLRSAYAGKNVLVQKEAHETFPAGGQFRNIQRAVDEVRVVFRAESDDDLTTSFGRADQSAAVPQTQIIDSGEQRFSTGPTNVYVRRFAIPLATIVPGDYVFQFGSGDDGWFFDVGVSSILTVSISAPGPTVTATHPVQGPLLRMA